jgi:hypothetical protein
MFEENGFYQKSKYCPNICKRIVIKYNYNLVLSLLTQGHFHFV